MKKFLVRFVLLGFVCLLLLLGLSRVYLKLVDTDYLRYLDGTLKFRSVPYEIEYAVFGSSHGEAAFQPGLLPNASVYDFCMNGQSMQLNAAIYAQYADHLTADAKVIIAISPDTLYCDPTGNITEMKRYCNAFPVDALPSTRMKLFRLFRAIDFRMSDITEYFRTRDITDVAAAEYADTLAGRHSELDTETMDWDAYAVARAQDFLDRAAPMPDDAGVLPSVRSAFDWMVADCQRRGYDVILYSPPYTQAFSACFSEAFRARVRSDAMALAQEYGVMYVDYSEDMRFVGNRDNFFDSDHLNTEGARAFMPVLLADAGAFYGFTPPEVAG